MIKFTGYQAKLGFSRFSWRVLGVALSIAAIAIFALLSLAQGSGTASAAKMPDVARFAIDATPDTSTPTNTPLPTNTPTVTCGSAWSVVNSANPGSSSNDLEAVVALATNNVWAVGSYTTSSSHTLTEQWNGNSWSVVTSPDAGAGYNGLRAVAAVNGNDVWAVGEYSIATGTQSLSLTEHWDGTQWSVVTSPNLNINTYLRGVRALATDNVWAVGYSCTNVCTGTDVQSMTIHWDGSTWTLVSTPNIAGFDNYLTSVNASGPNDIWAVGYYNHCYGCAAGTLTLHWDGTLWTIVSSPNVGGSTNYLGGVVDFSSTNAWAAGEYYTGSIWRTLILHWNGSTWGVATTPNAGQTDNFLQGMTATSANDIWAVGSASTNSSLTLHWDGITWNIINSPGTTGSKYLNSVSALSPDYVWAVGNNTSGSEQTLAQLYDDPCGTPVPTPTSTATITPGGPTLTPTQTISSTPTRTATYTPSMTRTFTTTPTRTNTPTNTLTSTSTTTPGCGVAWNIVNSDSPGSTTNELYSVAAVTEEDAWAVGSYASGTGSHTLTQHWNGSSWTTITSPSPGSNSNILRGVTEASKNSIWAVGDYKNSDGVSRTLIEHWDGGAWSVVPSPNLNNGHNYLNGVKALAEDDVWAAGYACASNCVPTADAQNLVLHWDGSTWTIVYVPNVAGQSNQLAAIDATGPDNIWAVGSYHSCYGCVSYSMTVHWDGVQWLLVSSPNVGGSTNYLYGVTTLSSTDAWAVGYYYTGSVWRTVILHWDGTAWSVSSSPNIGQLNNYLQGITAISANDVWAVGSWAAGNSLTLHWNGAAWSIITTPASAGEKYLNGVSALSSNYVWTVGHIDASVQTFTQLYSDPCGTPVPTSTPSATPNGPTATASRTATTTPTATDTNTPAATNTNTATAIDTGTPTPLPSTSTITPTPGCGLAWNIVNSEDPGTTLNDLYGVVALTANNVWAVGTYNEGNNSRTLTEHWNGTKWTIVDSPNAGAGYNILIDVTAPSKNDVWAVGDYIDGNQAHRLLIEHWDGGVWSIVSAPNVGGGNSYLYGIRSVAADDIWAVGYVCATTCVPPGDVASVALHWNGTTWSAVSVPNVAGQNNQLVSVGVNGPDDVWAVGYQNNCYGCTAQTLTVHWDGTQWTIVSSPNVGGSSNNLTGVVTLSGTDAWASGHYYTGSIWRTLMLHWNGTAWSVADSPNMGASNNYLQGITAISANDIWAVGSWEAGSALTLHWNGSTWNIVTSPTSAGEKYLNSVSALGPDYVWSVGHINSFAQTFTQLYSDPCATPGPTGTATNTPIATSTATETPPDTATETATSIPTDTATVTETPSDTPIGTPTQCNITFSDVALDSTFYPYIHCLACLGIINGYADGTFKPSNSVTRGQLSKIVSNSAGFSDAQTEQMFEDVAVGSTFQVYIGRLASRGYISGYPCGGAGEHCTPGNLPYFRPNANATRGQISKIVANAAGFDESPSGQQFEDVLPVSTYYTYTYRLATRNIMQGYTCGGPSEPCSPPANLPYFRPNNNATRGQTAKIDSGAFFPECSALGDGDLKK